MKDLLIFVSRVSGVHNYSPFQLIYTNYSILNNYLFLNNYTMRKENLVLAKGIIFKTKVLLTYVVHFIEMDETHLELPDAKGGAQQKNALSKRMLLSNLIFIFFFD